MRYAFMIALMLVLVPGVKAAEDSTRLAKPKTPTITENFQHYCELPDSSNWYCKQRKMLIPDSQKWDIVGGYCFDEVASPRPTQQNQLRAMLDLLLKDSSNPQRSHVCEEYQRVPPPMALMYNHRLGQWSNSNAGFEARRRTIRIDPVSLIPVAELAANDPVGIVVTDTNPLLFVANRGAAKEENVDQVKALEQLLALLGPALAMTTADTGRALISTRDVAAELSQLSVKPQWSDADRKELLTAVSRYSTLSGTLPTDAALREFAETAAADRADFLEDIRKLQQLTTSTKQALAPVDNRLKSLLTQRRWLQVAAQRLERGPVLLDGALDETLEDPASWRALFETLEKDSNAITSLASCASVFEAFTAVVSAKTEDPVTVSSTASRFLQFYNDGSGEQDSSICPELKYDSRLLKSVAAIQAAAQPAAREPGQADSIKVLRQAQADARERHLEIVLVMQRLIAQVESNRQGIKDVIAKEEETRKASLVLGLVGARARDAGVRIIEGKLLLTNRIYVMDEVYGSAATKSRTTPLKIVLNSQSSEAVPTDRPKEVTTSYRFERRGLDRVSFGVGMIAYTPAASTTYTAVDPDPSTNQSTTTTTTVIPTPGTTETTTVSRPELKIIREKDRQPRSGSYAIFVNGRLLGTTALGAGLQFGVATSTDHPAFLFGLSGNLAKYVTIGVGRGRFRLKELAADQTDTSVRVLNADEIRLDTNWRWANYLAISVNISGLPLFK